MVQDFINNNKRLPYENKDRGEDEYNLRIWLKTQIKIYEKNKFGDDLEKKELMEKLFLNNSHLFSKSSNLEIWISKYNELIHYIQENNKLPTEKVTIPKNIKDPDLLLKYEKLKALGIWKSNNVQMAKIHFCTFILDIDKNKLSIGEQNKYETRLQKYYQDREKEKEILSKDYSTLSKKDKLQYDKIKLKVEEHNKMIEEERFEATEKYVLWNIMVNKFPHLF